MKAPRKHNRSIVLMLLLGTLVVLTSNVRIVYAEPNAAPRPSSYEISWYTIDGGGAQNLTGGSYTLSGTIGQFDAGMQNGGAYNLNGGFWVDLFGFRLSLPLLLR